MTSIEETGKTIEEATEKALEVLGVTEDDVDVEILEEGARGFLGLGQSPARVKVTVKQKKAPEPAPKPRAARPKPAPKPRAEAQKPKREEPKPKPVPAPAAVAEKSAPAAEPVQAEQPVRTEKPVATGDVLKSAADISLEVVQRIVDSIEDNAKCVIKSTSDGQVVLEVTSEDPATIIGKHGSTIDAIQYLVGVITNKRLPEKVRVVVDVEGYRSRREEALRSQAFFLASKVKESGQEAVLEPLQANERRIIHTALADDPDVYTYSEGQDPERYIVISPRK